jgi:hypothetical protein
MNKIYLAAPFSWQKRILGYAQELTRMGYVQTGEWLDQEPSFINWDNSTNTKFAGLHAECLTLSIRDLRNIAECDTLILFEPGIPLERNTRVAEFGVALAWGKQCIVIGPEDEDKKDIISSIFVMLREKPKNWGGKWSADIYNMLDGIKPVIGFQTWEQFLEDISNPEEIELCAGCSRGFFECDRCDCGTYLGYRSKSGLLVMGP